MVKVRVAKEFCKSIGIAHPALRGYFFELIGEQALYKHFGRRVLRIMFELFSLSYIFIDTIFDRVIFCFLKRVQDISEFTFSIRLWHHICLRTIVG